MNFSKDELYKRRNKPLLTKQQFRQRSDFTNIGIPRRRNYYIGGDTIYYNHWYNSIIPIRDTIIVPAPMAYDELNYVPYISNQELINTYDNETESNFIINEEIEPMTDENESSSSSNNFSVKIIILIIFFYYFYK